LKCAVRFVDTAKLVIEGELEITVEGKVQRAGPGTAAIVPPNVPHAVRAITDGKAIVVDHPRRPIPGDRTA
jgi:quercetin dioxygenase-like cupin family protein